MKNIALARQHISNVIRPCIDKSEQVNFTALHNMSFLKHTILFFALLVMGISAHGQVCNLDFSLGPDAALNCNEALTLSAPASYTYLWNTTETTQSIDVNVSGTYFCTISETLETVVANGDFSDDINDFATDYAPGTGGAWGLLSAAGQYAIAANSADVHNNFVFCYDHTVGDASGSMLIVNGAALPDFKVWYQTVAVSPNTDYEFSFWTMSTVNATPAELNLTVDGIQIGATFFLTSATCDWQNYTTTWNSGVNTTVEIAIVNQSTSADGNDFAIDDIGFSPTCFFTDEIEILIPVAPEVTVDPDLTICMGEAAFLTAQSSIPGSTFTWQPGDLTGASITVTPSVNTEYSVFTTSPQSCDSEPMSLMVTVVDPGNYTLNLPTNFSTCSGISVQLNYETTDQGTFSWQPTTGLDNPSIGNPNATVSVDTDYTVTYTNACGQTQAANTTILANEVSFDLGPDILLCENESFTVTLTEGPVYTWQDGSNGNQFTFSETGIYMVTGVENNCTYSETIVVNITDNPDIDITGTLEVCPGDQGALTATAGNYSYIWNDGGDGNTIAITAGGIYSVDVTDLESGCQASAAVQVDNLPLPKVTLSETLDLCIGTTKNILALSANNSDLTWQDGTAGGNYEIASEGLYNVTATTVCGSIVKTLEVTEVNCEQTLFIPNSFSPNGDGFNDLFKAVGQGIFTFDIKIYDRWGSLLFSTKDIDQGWNGSENNEGYYVSNDTYTYIATVEYIDGSVVTKRGIINLIR